MFIGFNVDKANAAMQGVSDAYNSVTNTIKQGWEDVVAVLRAEWVGKDEQEFELKLRDRLFSLGRSLQSLSYDTVEVFDMLVQAWIKFQDGNNITSAANAGTEVSNGFASEMLPKIQKPSIRSMPTLSFSARTFDSATNFGLTNTYSASNIMEAMRSYVTTVQSNVESVYDQIDTNAAFFGTNQAQQLKLLKDKVGESMGIVATSIKDLGTAMEELTRRYREADETAGQSLADSAANIKSAVDDATAGTRWSSSGN